MQPWCACHFQCVAKSESETTGPVLKELMQFLLLLLGMNVVELRRKCVALCRLQQLPVTSFPQSILNGGGGGGITTSKTT